MYKLAIMLTAATFSSVVAARENEPVAAPSTAAAVGALLPANTEVVVRLNEALSSSNVRAGRRFEVSVARDVVVGNAVVIPRGTPGVGEVTWRTGRGAFGKSGKMEIAVTALSLDGHTVPMSGKTRLEGRGGTGAAIGAVFAGGLVAGAFVTGRSASFEQGHEWRAFTTETLALGGAAPVTAPVMVAAAPAAPAAPVAPVRPIEVATAPTVVHAAPVAPVTPVAPARPAEVVMVSVPTMAYAAPFVPARPAGAWSNRAYSVPVVRVAKARPAPTSDYAALLAATQGVRGYEPNQGWTISD
jgi:hypothetical protein